MHCLGYPKTAKSVVHITFRPQSRPKNFTPRIGQSQITPSLFTIFAYLWLFVPR